MAFIEAFCVFCYHEHPTEAVQAACSGFYLREIGQAHELPVEVVTCDRHRSHVLSSKEYALVDRLLEKVCRAQEG